MGSRTLKIPAPESIALGRLTLRRPRVSDAEAVFEYASDPEVARYADWPVRKDIEPLIEYLRERAASWGSGGEFSWVITLTGDDRAVGGVSCTIDGNSAEFGYLVHRRYWGRGIASEAARAVIGWALSNPTVSKVWATCDKENIASMRVLEKLGLRRETGATRRIVRPNISTEPREAFVFSLCK